MFCQYYLYAYFVKVNKMSILIQRRQLHLLTACPDTKHNEYLKFIEPSAKSGITHLQLRQKNWSFNSLLSLGRELCRAKTIPVPPHYQ